MLKLSDKEFLIEDRYYGGNQKWLSMQYFPEAACGPTTAANIFSYMIRTRPAWAAALENRAGLHSDSLKTKSGYTKFLIKVLDFVHFKMIELGTGAYSFEAGAKRFAKSIGLPLQTKRLKIAMYRNKRPAAEEIRTLIMVAIKDNTPVAFLNLAPFAFVRPAGAPIKDAIKEVEVADPHKKYGKVTLYKWHWVTVIGIDPEKELYLRILDNNSIYWADLSRWLADKKNSGSFVRLTPE